MYIRQESNLHALSRAPNLDPAACLQIPSRTLDTTKALGGLNLHTGLGTRFDRAPVLPPRARMPRRM